MRRFIASFLCATFATLLIPSAPVIAAADKQLQNVRGSVSYQTQSGTQRPVAPRSTVTLDDSDVAMTSDNSLGAIDLPDSSRILLGSNTKVTLLSFNRTDIYNASFVVVGKIRFKVEHPQGARANYTFKTPTAQIAVRGTQGDIVSDANGNVQINVYSLSNPQLPVQVTLSNGQVFTLAAGQSLTIGTIGGVLTGTVSPVTQTTFQPFSQFGAPENAASYGITAPTVVTTVAGTATITAVNAVWAVLGAIVVNTVVHTITSTFGNHAAGAAPAPSPSPSIPIVIH